jgi:hypothetical protein
MKDKNGIINEIQDALGSEGSQELAEQMYDAMRADDRVFYAGDSEGLKIRDGVDLIAVAAEVSNDAECKPGN